LFEKQVIEDPTIEISRFLPLQSRNILDTSIAAIKTARNLVKLETIQ
jgi:hypothetical protein